MTRKRKYKKNKSKGRGWHNEKRRHQLAGMGVPTTIDDDRRFDVSNFVARGKKSALTQAKVNYILESGIDEDNFWGKEIEKYFIKGFKDYPQESVKGDLFEHPDVKNPDEIPKEHFDHYMAGLEEAQKLKMKSVKSRGAPRVKKKYEGRDAKKKAKELLTVSTWRGDEEPNPKDVEQVVEYEDGRTFLEMRNGHYEVK